MAKTLDVIRSLAGLLLSMSLAIFFIAIYQTHKDQACDHPLQMWLLVMAIAQVTTVILAVVGFLSLYSEEDDSEEAVSLVRSEKRSAVAICQVTIGGTVCLFGLFLFVWFIVGNVWTFSLSPNSSGENCNRTVYLVSFWYIISCYILMGLTCVFGCLFACCKICAKN